MVIEIWEEPPGHQGSVSFQEKIEDGPQIVKEHDCLGMFRPKWCNMNTGGVYCDCNKHRNLLPDQPHWSLIMRCTDFVEVYGFCCGYFIFQHCFLFSGLSWHSLCIFPALHLCHTHTHNHLFLYPTVWLEYPLITWMWWNFDSKQELWFSQTYGFS